MVFGTSAAVTYNPDTPAQKRVSDFMQKVWTQFAKDPTALSKEPFKLPQYSTKDIFTEHTLIGFGANNLTRQSLKAGNYDMYCDTIASLLKTIPGGIAKAIENVASGKDMGIPGLKTSEIPDMRPLPLDPAPEGAV